MAKIISLFPHNEQAYEALISSLDKNPLAFIEHATGTGKSFIFLKALYTKMRKKRILFISMHDEMFEQLFNEQMPTLGINRTEFSKFDTMIYPNILKYNMQDIINNYDCIVFDEAHHCGAEKWGEKVLELKELVLITPGKYMIGGTATGIRYLDNYMDVSEIYFNGNTVSRLPISISILKNLLPAPLYINTKNSCLERITSIKNKFKHIPLTEETNKILNRLNVLEEETKIESKTNEILKKYGVKPGEKYIVFCRNINDLNQKRKEAEEWFKDIGPIKTFAAHSGQKKDKNINEIKEFGKSRNEISLMFAVDIFNEGFHIDGVDGVLMFRKTKSPIVYFQQIGRALSFSARKKQIKIFDFVNNIAESDVIYELYKEIISEAKKLIKEQPENKELYEEILKRFEIVDETTQIIDELKQIESLLDEKYILKNNLNNAINKLREYRLFYPDTNFRTEFANHRLSPEYINAYKYICHMKDHLTEENIILLQSLNISFSKDIDMPIEERKRKLKGCKTVHELKEAKYKEFISNYLKFYNENNRRPKLDGNKEELELYQEYRSYLNELSPSKLNNLLLLFPFKATVEEIILTGNYPDKESILEYINYIKYKIDNKISLDEIEMKVTKKIVKTISLKEIKLLGFLNNLDSINLKIEKAITTIANYKKVNKDENFKFIDYLVGEEEIYNAIKIIHKYAKRITTPQFEKLLALNITLPQSISMTLKKRLELLGPYNSFYEKEKGEGNFLIEEYMDFISKNNYRPTLEETPNLYQKYINFITRTTVPKLRELCSYLKLHNIELTFYEKIITGEPVDSSIIDEFVESINIKLHHNSKISNEELKLLRAIKRYKYSKSSEFIEDLIIEITNINDIDNCLIELENILEKQVNKNIYSIDTTKLIRQITSKSKFITKDHKRILEKLEISIPEVLSNYLDNTTFINQFDEEIATKYSFLEEYKAYITKNKKRPPKDSNIDKDYRIYIAKLSMERINIFCEIFTQNDLPLSFEEKTLLRHRKDISKEEQSKYIAYIDNKNKNNIPLDLLENRVINTLRKFSKVNFQFKKKIKREIKSDDQYEKDLINNLKECIARNPESEINYDNGIYNISILNRRRLEEFRLNLLSIKVFSRVLNKIKKLKQPLNICLSVDELIKFNELSKLSYLDEESKGLLRIINDLDNEYQFIARGIAKKEFISSYLLFIEQNNGRRPLITSENPVEQELALDFEEIYSLLSKEELSKIDRTIKKSIKEISGADFYQEFYNFIITNERFPCGNSPDEEEVRLNSLYQSSSKSFTKEQLLTLKKLKKKYTKSTLEANIRFSKLHATSLKKI